MLLPCFKLNPTIKRIIHTWVVPPRTKEIFIIVLLKKKAGGLGVPSNFFTLMKNLTYFQVSRIISGLSFVNWFIGWLQG